jgi:hypothetical protein
MRTTLSLLLLGSILFPAAMHAQSTWSKKTYTPTGFRVERADFTGDGLLDLFIYNGNDVTILPNAGNGTFDTTRAHSLNMQLNDAVLLDFNRDGNMDVAGCDDTGLVILQGAGDGTLALSQTVQTPCAWVASADFNHDGNPDIAVGNPAPSGDTGNQVIIFLGDGHGGISGQVVNNNVDFISVDGNPCSLNGRAVAADFTGDKVADIAITADCFNGTFSAAALIVGKGDGTGHFTFHKDQDFNLDSGMKLRPDDVNQDGRVDLIGVGNESAPHGSGGTDLVAFISKGDGTFTFTPIVAESITADDGNFITAGTVADVDGDGIKDAVIGVDSVDVAGNESFSFRFYKGQSDGSFKLAQTSALASRIFDMVWGDFDKDARPDLVLIRPNSTDVWLNATASASTCRPELDNRALAFCTSATSTGTHFLSSPLDNFAINAIQIYVDGTLKFETPDDLLDTNLQLSPGAHRITVKAWDALGPFSSSTGISTACSNTANRTVKICTPVNGTTVASPVEIVATVATSLKFTQSQVYVDGVLKFSTSSKSVDFTTAALAAGTHRFTVKGWDSTGAFSSSVTVTVH